MAHASWSNAAVAVDAQLHRHQYDTWLIVLNLHCDFRRLVVSQLAKDQKWQPGQWAFDGRKNIYTPAAFLPKEERSYQVMV